MLMWMLYATVVGVVLGAAGLSAERGVRRLGLPVRRVWVVVMTATVAAPIAALVGVGSGAGAPIAAGAAAAGSAGDASILAAWAVVSLLLLTGLRLSAWTLRRNERSWRGARVDGRLVKVSAGFGPGVIGAVRPRVVLPRWVLETDRGLRRLVLLHETEHVRAGDTRLLVAGLALTVLVPWCLPLWWDLQRLREAIETDCDARVLAQAADTREYANALVAIAGRPAPRLLPVPALAPAGHELERRIRLITAGGRRSRPAGVGLLGLAVVLALGIGLLPAPGALPAPGLPELHMAAPVPPVAVPAGPRTAKVYLSVAPESEPAGSGPDR